MARTATKYARIRADIESAVKSGQFVPGQTIPSYNDLMKRYGVSRATVHQAMKSLQDTGIVEGIPGKGCVVTEPLKAWRHAGLVCFDKLNDHLIAASLHSLQPCLDELRLDLSLRMQPKSDATSLNDVIAWAKRLDGILVGDCITPLEVEQIADAGVKLVVFGEIAGACPQTVSQITVDIKSSMTLTLAHLRGLGHEHILFVNRTSRGTLYSNTLSDVFRQELGQAAMEFRLGNNEEEEAALPGYLTQLPTRPTALLVEGEERADRLILALTQAGFRIPEDLSVMAISGKIRARQIGEGLSCICFGNLSLWRHAVALLRNTMDYPNSPIQKEAILGQLHVGDTCRHVDPLEASALTATGEFETR
jgi:GntR family transcriptional regulator, arabinose operon transcriptional repressor